MKTEIDNSEDSKLVEDKHENKQLDKVSVLIEAQRFSCNDDYNLENNTSVVDDDEASSWAYITSKQSKHESEEVSVPLSDENQKDITDKSPALIVEIVESKQMKHVMDEEGYRVVTNKKKTKKLSRENAKDEDSNAFVHILNELDQPLGSKPYFEETTEFTAEYPLTGSPPKSEITIPTKELSEDVVSVNDEYEDSNDPWLAVKKEYVREMSKELVTSHISSQDYTYNSLPNNKQFDEEETNNKFQRADSVDSFLSTDATNPDTKNERDFSESKSHTLSSSAETMEDKENEDVYWRIKHRVKKKRRRTKSSNSNDSLSRDDSSNDTSKPFLNPSILECREETSSNSNQKKIIYSDCDRTRKIDDLSENKTLDIIISSELSPMKTATEVIRTGSPCNDEESSRPRLQKQVSREMQQAVEVQRPISPEVKCTLSSSKRNTYAGIPTDDVTDTWINDETKSLESEPENVDDIQEGLNDAIFSTTLVINIEDKHEAQQGPTDEPEDKYYEELKDESDKKDASMSSIALFDNLLKDSLWTEKISYDRAESRYYERIQQHD